MKPFQKRSKWAGFGRRTLLSIFFEITMTEDMLSGGGSSSGIAEVGTPINRLLLLFCYTRMVNIKISKSNDHSE